MNIDQQIDYWAHMLDESKTMMNERTMTNAEFKDFSDKLDRGVVEFKYMAKVRDSNGNPVKGSSGKDELRLRTAKGTRVESEMPPEKYRDLMRFLSGPTAKYMIAYYDLDKEDLRLFNIHRFEGVQNFISLERSQNSNAADSKLTSDEEQLVAQTCANAKDIALIIYEKSHLDNADEIAKKVLSMSDELDRLVRKAFA